MDDAMKKKISIGIAVGCITLAVIITVATNRSGSVGPVTPTGSATLMCTNPQCGAVFEMERKDLAKSDGEIGGTAGPPTYKCPKCGQMSARIAMKCAKCGNVFISDYQNLETGDKCPKCGYSALEEAKKKGGQ
jgi:DNA-directed RNA polymerase subunit RPC12/RpoP